MALHSVLSPKKVNTEVPYDSAILLCACSQENRKWGIVDSPVYVDLMYSNRKAETAQLGID